MLCYKIRILALSCLILLTSCEHLGNLVSNDKILNKSKLVDQILRPRKGHEPNLTNFTCKKKNLDKCEDWDKAFYDVNDSDLRKRLNDLGFVCSIAGKRYKVCLDRPGFCRFGAKRKYLLFKSLELVDYIPISQYTFLIDSDSKCYNKNKYRF